MTSRGPAFLAASPDAAADRVLLMVGYGGSLLRSTDEGRTWHELPAVGFGVTSLVLAPRVEQLRLAFATDTNAVYRSVDAGTSWQQVLHADGSEFAFHVVLSPAFATDGHVFVSGMGRLWRSSDWGATWEQLAPAAGQFVNQIVLSPDFARDRTVYIAAASSPLPVPGQSWPPDAPDAPDASLGIAISNDGGDSWQPAGDGLEVDGASFRQLNQLTPSPTFSTDGVLFAFAGGPWVEVVTPAPGGASIPSQRGALLRSRDRGASWAVVYDTTAVQFEPHLALSPNFARDGVGVLALRRAGYSPSSSGCTVLRTGDGGESWTTQLRPSSYEGCGENAFSVLLAGKPAFFVQKGAFRNWRQSTDTGLSWRYLEPPAPTHPLAVVATAPAGQSDSVVFGVTHFDPQYVWAYGAFGACAQQPILGFGSVWNQDAAVREQLGCARAAEHPVRVRVRERLPVGASALDRDYWPEDDTPIWWSVSRFGDVSTHAKAEGPWTNPPLRLLDGAIQPFEHGSMLFVRESDGSEQILTLIG